MKIIAVILSVMLVLFLSVNFVYGFDSSDVQRDIVFSDDPDALLKMDLYFPDPTGFKTPVLIYIHGGGWYSGDKTDNIAQLFIPDLVKRGYCIAAINYRLSPKYKFPAQIEDVVKALNFLRSNGEKYNLDLEHMGVFGDSAGGHLAALLGSIDSNCLGVPKFYPVQAVVDIYGPTDLSLMFQKKYSMLIEHVFNTSDPESKDIRDASPINYVSPNDPPFLIIHGEEDDIVSIEQSRILYEKLIFMEVPTSLVTVKNCGHGFAPINGDLNPCPVDITEAMGEFFDQYLK